MPTGHLQGRPGVHPMPLQHEDKGAPRPGRGNLPIPLRVPPWEHKVRPGLPPGLLGWPQLPCGVLAMPARHKVLSWWRQPTRAVPLGGPKQAMGAVGVLLFSPMHVLPWVLQHIRWRGLHTLPPWVCMHALRGGSKHVPRGHILQRWGVCSMPIRGDNAWGHGVGHLAGMQLQGPGYLLHNDRIGVQEVPAGLLHPHQGRGWALCKRGQGVQVRTRHAPQGHASGGSGGRLGVHTVPSWVLLHTLPPLTPAVLGAWRMVGGGLLQLLPGVPGWVLLQRRVEHTLPALGLLPGKLG